MYTSTAIGKSGEKSMSSLVQLNEVSLASLLAAHLSIFPIISFRHGTALPSGMGWGVKIRPEKRQGKILDAATSD